MKPSPLQLESPTYPVLSVHAVPDHDRKLSKGPLPVEVEATVLYDGEGTHFAYLSIEQNHDHFPYLVDIDVFTTFTIDVDGCREAYKAAFNPQVVAVNIVRILYSSAREMLGLLTSRGPHGEANLPSVMIEPADVKVEFERDKLDVILTESFGLSPEEIKAALAKLEQVRAAQEGGAKSADSADGQPAEAGKAPATRKVPTKKARRK